MKVPLSFINISSTNIKSCEDVAKFLQLCKINCSVTPNKTVRFSNGNYVIENGCCIRLDETKPKNIEKDVWQPLKKSFKLNCAYLSIPGKFSGCIDKFNIKKL